MSKNKGHVPAAEGTRKSAATPKGNRGIGRGGGGGGGGACNVNLGKRRRERAEKTHCVYFAFFVCDYDGYGEGG